MANNAGLREANKAKEDEFYTQLDDIEKELRYYSGQLRDKVILCNCDDPYESNFFKYFASNFNYLGLKKLIATCYDGSPIAAEQLSLFDIPVLEADSEKHAYKIEINEVKDYNNDGAVDLSDVEYLLKNKKNTLTLLRENGDFRSDECKELLDESDVVITNPPFSLFREFVSLLEEKNKKYLLISNTNALTYKEIFKLFKENKIRTGNTNFNVGMYFKVPEDTENYHKVINNEKYVRVATSCWLTNLEVSKHNQPLVLYKQYEESEYKKYANFDAINIDKYLDIPIDYNGVMGVPVTFLDKYCPEQFEIIGLGISNSGIECGVQPYTEEHKRYRKETQNKGAVDGDLYMLDDDGHPVVPYARVLIKAKG